MKSPVTLLDVVHQHAKTIRLLEATLAQMREAGITGADLHKVELELARGRATMTVIKVAAEEGRAPTVQELEAADRAAVAYWSVTAGVVVEDSGT
jgi:hypothetical protein